MDISKIYKLISNGNLKESIDYILKSIDELDSKPENISETYSTLILLSGKLARIEKDLILGVIEYEKGELFKVGIGKGILTIAKEINKETNNKDVTEDAAGLNDVSYSDYEMKSLNGYFKSLFNSIGLESIKINITKGVENEVRINIPESKVKKIINNIETTYEKSSGKAYHATPNTIVNDENVKKILLGIYTQRELEVLEASLINANSNEIAKKLYISRITVQVYQKNILKKFKSIFKDEELIRTSKDVANYLHKIGII
ncbi:LuxR C-terminal-related transcriptional regulator [Haliscomenobacter sp.]|uniref:LuxR C-terminal-related transcriptional regulator n=1 Tax=Haliscomenobacter sp. TaxID=2717303 RepID=UPI003BACBFE7